MFITTRDKEVAEITDAWACLRKAAKVRSRDFPVLRADSRENLINERLNEKIWSGGRCFLIGGGPSLRNFDFSQLDNELTIAINRAHEFINSPSVIFFMDKEDFYDKLMCGEFGQKALKKFNKSHAMKMALNISGHDYGEDIHSIPISRNPEMTFSLKDGIYDGENSGFAALNLAVCMGAKEIYLLGYDMKGDGQGNQTWFHGGYKRKGKESNYKGWIKHFKGAVPLLKQKGIEVINLNPDSALRCFEFKQFKDIKPIEWPMIISFYTRNTGYEKEIKNLIGSLKRFNLEHKIYKYSPKGTWRNNLNYKSLTILRALEEFPEKDIVFIDADAIVRKYPLLFTELSKKKDYDIAAHFFDYDPRSGILDELLSGTLWIQNSKKGRKLIEEWHGIALDNSSIIHQRCLKIAIQKLNEDKTEIEVYRLPFEYTCIFDYEKGRKLDPVIEHFQASRYLRREVGYGEHLNKGRV